MANLEFDIKKLNNSITMKVKINIKKQFYIRMFIATKLIKLAAKILNCRIEIDINDNSYTDRL